MVIWTTNMLMVTTWWYLHHSGWVPAIPLVAVGALHEDGGVREALCKHFPTNVIETHTLSNVAARLFHYWVAINVRQQAQAETLTVAGVCGETNRKV